MDSYIELQEKKHTDLNKTESVFKASIQTDSREMEEEKQDKQYAYAIDVKEEAQIQNKVGQEIKKQEAEKLEKKKSPVRRINGFAGGIEPEEKETKTPPGQMLEKYIAEVRSKQSSEKKKKNKEKLEAVLEEAQRCYDAIKNGNIRESAADQIDVAISKIKIYLNATRSTFKKDNPIEMEAENRTLREAVRLLETQLTLDQRAVYATVRRQKEQQAAKERELYLSQLELDAKTNLYKEHLDQYNAEKEDTEQKKVASESMEALKQKMMLEEYARQNSIYSDKIKGNQAQTLLLQDEIEKNNFTARNEKLRSNRQYQRLLKLKMNEQRKLLANEWMRDNLNKITDNVKNISEFVKKPEIEKKVKELSALKDFDKLLEMELRDNGSLTIVAGRYQKMFEALAKETKENRMAIPKEIQEFVASQVVLLEKRGVMNKEKEAAEGDVERLEQSDLSHQENVKKDIKKKEEDLADQDVNNEEAMKKMAEEERDAKDSKEKEQALKEKKIFDQKKKDEEAKNDASNDPMRLAKQSLEQKNAEKQPSAQRSQNITAKKRVSKRKGKAK